jgi:hypothetical protein
MILSLGSEDCDALVASYALPDIYTLLWILLKYGNFEFDSICYIQIFN